MRWRNLAVKIQMTYMRRVPLTASFLACIAFLVGCIGKSHADGDIVKITVSNNGNPRDFYVDENYLSDRKGGAVRDYLIIHASYPDMIPCYRSDVVMARHCMMIVIKSGDRKTRGESIVEEWNARKHRTYNGPGFDRYIGTEDGYDIYETLPTGKSGNVYRTQVFYDASGDLVSDSNPSDARFFGLVVRYERARFYGATPKEMHAWVGSLLVQLMSNKMEVK